jgi:hypothetical protein
MRLLWMAVVTAACCVAAGPARAADKTIALLPAHVLRGNPENRARVTNALRQELEQHGFRVLRGDAVERALRQHRADLRRPIAIATLAELRTATGADYLVYPRVLSVGVGVNSEEYQANVIVNVVGPASAKQFLHTRQIGQVFRSRVRRSEDAVIGAEAAGEQARKLLEGFLSKAER